MPYFTKALSSVAVSLAALLTSGCMSCKDVSADQTYLGSARIGQVYRLRSPVFYYNANTGRLPFDHYLCTPEYWLLPERNTSLEQLPYLEDYLKTLRPNSIRSIVEAGTCLSLRQVLYHDYFEDRSSYYVFTLLDGPLSGRPICANELMEQVSAGDRLHRVPSAAYLEVTQ